MGAVELCVVCGTRLPPEREGDATCSRACHEEFVRDAEERYGVYKRVVDGATGVAHRVPTRDIIERGIRQADLRRYPVDVDA